MNLHEKTETQNETRPLVSVVLVDWSVREQFHSLEWLCDQDVPRNCYELLWVELYGRVVPTVVELADTVITCEQRGTYHKHVGYNAGLLHARGKVVTVCDSDAVFPSNFIRSIVERFELDQTEVGRSCVLMHHERRTLHTYPDKLISRDQLEDYDWQELWPNVGACMSVLRSDAIRFGGFDEHKSFRGYYCGPYDLGWRLVNAGIPEVWHDESVVLSHFAHAAAGGMGAPFSIKRWWESCYPHIEHHALKAVEAFSTGRVLPLAENVSIHRQRMELRRIGTPFEEKYATLTGPEGISRWYLWRLRLELALHPVLRVYRKWFRLKTLNKLRAKLALRTRLKTFFRARTSVGE